jgi:2-keto-3-deoxy-L-rhamnonate aldolase RhmA
MSQTAERKNYERLPEVNAFLWEVHLIARLEIYYFLNGTNKRGSCVLASGLKSRIRAKQLTLGVMLTFDFWPGYLEILKAEGMHFAILDMEHGSASSRTAEELCRTARLLEFPLIIRPEASLYHLLRKYLDMGPAGLMIPWTERQEQIDTLREAAFLPPKGRRGPGGPAILANRSLDRAGWSEIEAGLFLMTQIESPAGLRNLSSLVSQNWIDATMVGPYDFSLNLSCWGQLDHPDVVTAIEQVRAESLKVGKPCGMVVGSVKEAKVWMDRGFHFLICSEVSAMVRHRARILVSKITELFPGSC